MRRILVTTLLIIAATVLSSCSDGDSEKDPFFKVTIAVEDADGNPVPGLGLELTSDNAYLQDFKGDKARAAIQMTVPVPAQVKMAVHDIEGGLVKLLIDGILPAGRHEVMWDGKNLAGEHQPSGRYTVRMIAFAGEMGELVFEDTVDILMCLVDPSYSSIGTTDEKGVVTLKDKKHFPHLYDREPMTATDESGEPQGQLEPTADMIVSLADSNGAMMVFRKEIPGQGIYRFVWDRNKARAAGETGKAEETVKSSPVIPPVEWRLGPVYPNPFN